MPRLDYPTAPTADQVDAFHGERIDERADVLVFLELALVPTTNATPFAPQRKGGNRR